MANFCSTSAWTAYGSLAASSASPKKSTYDGWCSGEKSATSGWNAITAPPSRTTEVPVCEDSVAASADQAASTGLTTESTAYGLANGTPTTAMSVWPLTSTRCCASTCSRLRSRTADGSPAQIPIVR